MSTEDSVTVRREGRSEKEDEKEEEDEDGSDERVQTFA